MSSAQEVRLPRLSAFNASIPPNLNPTQIASDWFREFTSSLESANVDQVLSLLVEDALWRDILSITWDSRTIHGSPNLKPFLEARLADAKLRTFKLESVGFTQIHPDLAWIQGLFVFAIGEVGDGAGVFRIVPTSTGKWKGHCIYTNLESLKQFPEKTGPTRDPHPSRGNWVEKRQKEQEYAGVEPYVLIIGGGHCGLEVAARLKHLDVSTLIIEKEDRLGSQWRGRYDSLCMNEPVWRNHLPYIPYPPSWPTFAPAKKFADWLEFYAHSLELNIWLLSTVVSVRKDADTQLWNVVVRRRRCREDKEVKERVFHPVHVVFAVGHNNTPNVPDISGKEEFSGQILHSSQHQTASDYVGKKVVVVGAGTSAHDISADCVVHEVDVTMYQRSPVYVLNPNTSLTMLSGPYQEDGPPTAIADRISASFPMMLIKPLSQRLTKYIAENDKEFLDGLTRRGFKWCSGIEGSGLLFLAVVRDGGYYLNFGASDLIVNGQIKMKSDSVLERFTKHGLRFEDGSELEADVVILATGYSNYRKFVQRICGDELTSQVKELGGLDEEYEVKTFWRYCGVDNLWFAAGGLALARHRSKHLALQIKAIKEGVHGARYSR